MSDPVSGSFKTKAAEPCSQPLIVRATVNTDSKGFKLTWENIPGQTGAEIRYRKVMQPEALWTTQTINGLNELEIKDLIPKSRYEYKAKPLCSTGITSKEAGGFVTLTKDKVKPDVAYQCGKSRLSPSNNKIPLNVPLEVGDYILIGDFPAQIDRLETGSAPYKGLAHVLVPYLGMSNFLMAFTGLTVNTDYEVISGEMHSVNDPVALAQIKAQNAERIKQQVEAVKQLVSKAKEAITKIGDLFSSSKPLTAAELDTYVQQQNEVIAELSNTDPDLAAAIKAKEQELIDLLKPYRTAANNDYQPTRAAADDAKAATIAAELADLNEKAKTAVATPEPPPYGEKDSNIVEETIVTRALLYEMRYNCKRNNGNRSATTANNETFTVCSSGANRYYFYKQDDFWRINNVFYWEDGYNSGKFYRYQNGIYVAIEVPEGQYALELLANDIRDLFFIKTPLILLSAGTSGTVTEFAIDQIGGVLLDKLQADGAINVETNLLGSLILGAVGSKSVDAEQLKAMIEQIKTLAKKAKPGDLKQLIADVVEEWKLAAKKGVVGGGSVFDLTVFKNLSARIPTGSLLTNLKKSEFLNYGYKLRPTSGELKTKIDDIIANGDNLGSKTESIVDDLMSQNGYTKMDGKYGSNNGYDGIYIKGDISNPMEIIIVESKQFKYTNGVADGVVEHSGVTLNPPSGSTPLPAQMSDGWIDYVALKLNDGGKTDVGNMILLNKNKITKYVSAIDKTQSEINFLKLGNYN